MNFDFFRQVKQNKFKLITEANEMTTFPGELMQKVYFPIVKNPSTSEKENCINCYGKNSNTDIIKFRIYKENDLLFPEEFTSRIQKMVVNHNQLFQRKDEDNESTVSQMNRARRQNRKDVFQRILYNDHNNGNEMDAPNQCYQIEKMVFSESMLQSKLSESASSIFESHPRISYLTQQQEINEKKKRIYSQPIKF